MKTNLGMHRQMGAALLEVLVAVAISAIALAALAIFNSTTLKTTSYANSRTMATNLAEQKINELRSYKYLDCDTTCQAAGNLGYTNIASKTDIAVPRGNNSYTVETEVKNYYYCKDNEPPVESKPTDCNKTYPDFKKVKVSVSWRDPIDKDKDLNVVLEGSIYPNNPLVQAGTVSAPGANDPPPIKYTPQATPDMVPILAADSETETSRPVPRVGTGSSDSIISTFDSVTYDTDSCVGGECDVLKYQQVAALNCDCKFATVAEVPEVRTLSRYVWKDGSLQLELGELAPWLSKPRGKSNDIKADPLCDVCCRDHHDDPTRVSPSLANAYDPFRGELNHKHYNDISNPAVTTGAYKEACYMIRNTDGFWYVMQDVEIIAATVISYDYLRNSTNLSAYQQYVKDVVLHEIAGTGPVDKSSLPTRDQSIPRCYTTQLLGRVILMQYLDTAHQNALKAMADADNKISNLYFQEINLTLLGDWTSDSAAVPVLNKPIKTVDIADYYETYERGVVTGAGITSDPKPKITFTTRLGSTGLNGSGNNPDGNNLSTSYWIDPKDRDEFLSDFIEYEVTALSDKIPVSGYFNYSNQVPIEQRNGIVITPPYDVDTGLGCQILGVGSLEYGYNCIGLQGQPLDIKVEKSDLVFSNGGVINFGASLMKPDKICDNQNFDVTVP